MKKNLVTNIDLNKQSTLLNCSAPVWKSFAYIANKFPKRIAMETKDSKTSYHELYVNANQLAIYLHSKNIKKIALIFDCSDEMIATMLACLKNNITYIPLSPNIPSNRLIDIVINSGVAHILADLSNEKLMFKISSKLNLESLNFESVRRNRLTQIEDKSYIPNITKRPAYILYTSGSTGDPKGVIQSQHNILRHIQNYSRSLGINENDNLSLLSSYATDASIMDIYSSLLNGATLFPIDIKNEPPENILLFLAKKNITILHIVPTLFRNLMEFTSDNIFLKKARFIVLGGEPVNKQDIKIFNQKFCKNTILVNGYGPTECTVAFQFFIKNQSYTSKLIPIGKPLKGINFFLRNVDKVSKVGEIVLQGKGVAYGYWNNQYLTDKSFKISTKTGVNTFYTGDYGYKDSDGNLVYVGRQDSQIKINGNKVSLPELESFLLTLSTIENAAVIDIKKGNNIAIVVYITCKKNHIFCLKIRKQLELNFPSYMLPLDIITLDKLPLTLSGKINRVKLKKQYRSSSIENKLLAKSPIQKQIITIYQKVLNQQDLSIDKSMIELGGNSLMMLKVIMYLQRIFEIDISLNKVSVNSTILDIEKFINRESFIKAKKEKSTYLEKNFFSLSQLQLRYWHRIKGGLSSSALNIAYSVQIDGNFNLNKFCSLLEEILLRHKVFRTYFIERNGIPYQSIGKKLKFKPKIWDLEQVDFSYQQKLIKTRKQTLLKHPFDLLKGNLYNIEFIRINQYKYIMLYVFHHLIIDGWSNRIFLKEIFSTYKLSAAKTDLAPKAKINEYQNYVYLEQKKIKLLNDKKIDYWRTLLPSYIDFNSKEKIEPNSQKGAVYKYIPNKEFVKNLKSFAIENNISLFIIYLSLFKLTLYLQNKVTKLFTTTDITERDNYQFEFTIGLFTNILIIPVTLIENKSIKQNIKKIFKAYNLCFENRVPFSTLMNEISLGNLRYYDKFFPNVFIFQNEYYDLEQLNGIKVTHSELLNLNMSRDLIFEVVCEDSLFINIYYKINNHDSSEIHKFAKIYENLMNIIYTKSSIKLSELNNLEQLR